MQELVIKSQKGQDVTTSLIIAEVFGKSHDDVLKAIRSLDCPDEFSLGNFTESEYINERGRKYTAYEITRDGFTFLAMGFRGKKAAKFKIDFINEFNRRGEALAQSAPTVPAVPTTQAQLTLMIAQQLVNHEEKLIALEEKVNEVAAKQIGSSTDYFSVAGFSSLRRQPIDNATASGLSRRCHTLCQQLGYQRNEIPDPRFGRVYTYPKIVLERIFNQYYPQA